MPDFSWWAIMLVLPGVILAIRDWRQGLFAMIVVAFLQDPARKLALDRPVYFTLLAGVVFAAVYVRAQGLTPFLPSRIPGWKQHLRIPVILLVMLLALQGVYSLLSYGNPMMVAIGALSYLAPLPAMLVGYHFAAKVGANGVRRWLAWYLVVALVMLSGLLLEFAGVEWETLGDVGWGMAVAVGEDFVVAHSGFFRTSETAAWHTATSICLLLLLNSMRRLSRRRVVIVIGAAVGLLALGLLTGRRKLFVEVVIFVSVYLSLLSFFGKGGFKLAVAILIGGLLSWVAVMVLVSESPSDGGGPESATYQRYFDRGATVAVDISDRFLGMGIGPVEWAIARYGIVGGGLGIASQGAQHFGGGDEIYGGAGEGGLGKITAELGVPGLVLAAWFAVALLRLAWRILVFVSGRSKATARLAYGLIALLIANAAVFVVATQVFGDLFILLLLGLIAGCFLATPVLAEREAAASVNAPQPARSARPAAAAGVVGAR